MVSSASWSLVIETLSSLFTICDALPAPVTADLTACGWICSVAILACTLANSAIAITLAVISALLTFLLKKGEFRHVGIRSLSPLRILALWHNSHPDDASGTIIEAVWDKLRETEAADLGFCECECVGCGESVLVANEEIHVSGKAWCYDCEKRYQAYEPSMTGGE